MKYRVLPYRQGSKGAKALALALGGRVLKLEGSLWKPKPGDVVVNWGNTSFASQRPSQPILNPIEAIKAASNKLFFFRLLAETGLTPLFWEKKEDIPDEAFPIVCRTVLAGHSGDGIVIAATRDDLVHAPLYVKYVKKQDEYRIHVGRKADASVIISVQRKARRHDTPDNEVNWRVRNHSNGFVYVRNDVNPPLAVLDAAKSALAATDLDFGAVDVIYNSHSGKAYVLEINTAPGLEGQTVDDYAKFFKDT